MLPRRPSWRCSRVSTGSSYKVMKTAKPPSGVAASTTKEVKTISRRPLRVAGVLRLRIVEETAPINRANKGGDYRVNNPPRWLRIREAAATHESQSGGGAHKITASTHPELVGPLKANVRSGVINPTPPPLTRAEEAPIKPRTRLPTDAGAERTF